MSNNTRITALPPQRSTTKTDILANGVVFPCI